MLVEAAVVVAAVVEGTTVVAAVEDTTVAAAVDITAEVVEDMEAAHN